MNMPRPSWMWIYGVIIIFIVESNGKIPYCYFF